MINVLSGFSAPFIYLLLFSLLLLCGMGFSIMEELVLLGAYEESYAG